MGHLIAGLAVILGMNADVAASERIFMRTPPGGSVELSNVPSGDDYQLLIGTPPASALSLDTATTTATQAPAPPLDTTTTAAPAPAPSPATARNTPLERGVAQYRELVAAAARHAAVDARLVHAVIAVESGYNPQAVSRKGALGLMQLMPATARRYGVGDARDPQQNLLGGARYLRDLLTLFNDDISLALAAYNAGENAVRRHGNRIPPIAETTAYVPKVLAIYRKLENLLI